MPAVIIAEKLAKSYGKVTAVDGLDLRVDEGSIMGLIGPNGAGKTTTIKMILGLLRPDKGHVEVFGREPWDNPDLKWLIGVVYERAYFPSSQKLLKYLKRVCRIFGVPESRANEVLKLVDLHEAFDRQIKALSAGMLQKFAIAHAFIHEPKLVVADEITTNLDPQTRGDVLNLIAKLHKEEKTTFLLSSHILPELSRVCDSVTIMSHGKVLASGNLLELYEKFAARTLRILTDKPEALAALIKNLAYTQKVGFDANGISVRVIKGTEEKIYGDILKQAKQIEAEILGIETASISLEELYRSVVASQGEITK